MVLCSEVYRSLQCLQIALEQSCLKMMVERKKGKERPCPLASIEKEPQGEVHWASLGNLLVDLTVLS